MLTLCMLGKFPCFCCLLTVVDCLFLQKLTFSKNSFRNTIRVPNGLNPDQGRHYVGPDLGPNCLQMLSADDKGKVLKGYKNIFTIEKNSRA